MFSGQFTELLQKNCMGSHLVPLTTIVTVLMQGAYQCRNDNRPTFRLLDGT